MPGLHFKHSIRQRIIRLILLTSGLAFLCVAVAVTIYESTTFRPRQLDALKNTSRLLLEVLPGTLDFGGYDTANTYLRTYAEETQPGVVVAALYDAEGALFAIYSSDGIAYPAPKTIEPSNHRFTAHELILWQPVNRGTTTIGHLYLLKILPPFYARLPQYAIMAGAVLFALIIVGFVLIHGVRRNLLNPLATLLATATHVTVHRDYSARAELNHQDELGHLANAFNRMLEVIGQRAAELDQANTFIRNVFAATSEVAIIATDTNGLVTLFNTGAEHMLGYTSAEIVNRATPILWHKAAEIETRATTLSLQLHRKISGYETFVALATEGQSDANEWAFIRKDGTERRVILVVTAMHDNQGKLTGHLGVATDITRRQQAEAEREKLQGQLIHAQKMEAIGQLAGGVAHDFNNILAAMLMHIGILRDEPTISPEMRAALDEQQEFVNRAANLTRQLLLFGRREVMQKQPIDLDALLGNLLKMLRRLIGENISIEFKGSPKATWINADCGMIEQVVMNLVVNARDAIQTSGRITLSTAIVKPTATAKSAEARPGAFVQLTVTDTGSGMEASTLEHIFEPFFTTKDQGKGTGLGLATVYGIVKRHEGWIEVDSSPGHGTSFHIFIPTAPPKRDTPPITNSKTNSAPSGRETIFLVEDDESVRSAAHAVLRQAGYQIICAVNGPKAIDLWKTRTQKIDLLLTDMIMPEGLTGLELVKRLRIDEPDLKVVIMSGYSLELSQQDVLKNERLTYLSKPFESSGLAQTVRRVLDRN